MHIWQKVREQPPQLQKLGTDRPNPTSAPTCMERSRVVFEVEGSEGKWWSGDCVLRWSHGQFLSNDGKFRGFPFKYHPGKKPRKMKAENTKTWSAKWSWPKIQKMMTIWKMLIIGWVCRNNTCSWCMWQSLSSFIRFLRDKMNNCSSSWWSFSLVSWPWNTPSATSNSWPGPKLATVSRTRNKKCEMVCAINLLTGHRSLTAICYHIIQTNIK